jgi:hypothetical protein
MVIAFWECEKWGVEVARTAQRILDNVEQRIEACVYLGSQSVGFLKASEAKNAQAIQLPHVMVRLPSAEARGTLVVQPDNVFLQGDITLDRFIGTFKPSVLEKLLSIFKAMEQDGQALASIGRSMKQNKPTTVSNKDELEEDQRVASRRVRYAIGVYSRGLCVSLQAAQVISTLTVRTGAISGNIESDDLRADPKWTASVSSLSLTLGHWSKHDRMNAEIGHRASQSASMEFSLRVSQEPEMEKPDGSNSPISHPTTVAVNLANVHATLQVSALDEIYELLGSWSADLGAMRKKRRDEWEKVITKTERLMKSESPNEPAKEVEDWFMMKRVINVRLTGLAIAIPLTLDDVRRTARENTPALLFTVAQVQVSNQKGDSGMVEIIDVILQIVARYVCLSSYEVKTESEAYWSTDSIQLMFHSTMASFILLETECIYRILLWKFVSRRENKDWPLQTARSKGLS